MSTNQSEAMEPMSLETPDALMLLGQLAIRFHMISETQLQQALVQHKDGADKPPVGQTLVEMGLINESQRNFLLNAQEMKALRTSDIKFGKVAVENGFVTEEQVEAGLKRQKEHYIKYKKKTLLGDILVANGMISEEQRQNVITAQKRIKKLREEHSTEAPVALEEELLSAEEGVALAVSKDRMKATLRVAPSVEIDEIHSRIKELLAEYEVIYGVVDESVIAEWVKRGEERAESLIIAQGKAAVPGHGGEIHYHFDTDPLKAGKIRDGDVIDFKDRGEIPQVEEAALLAELSEPGPGTAGTDVHGKEIAPPAIKLKKLLCDKGVTLSEDSRQVVAAVSGSPSLAKTGALSVFPLYKIEGNVGYKTGHIDFDGDIQVAGTVEKDFRVKGGMLSATEVEHAEIEVKGDVVISGGILGGHIKVGGNLMAAYIHNAQLEVDGDVLVQKEVMGCDIKSGGGFYSKTSIVLDSRISAKQGIIAGDIGSEVSGPSSLSIGSDALLELRIGELNDTLIQHREQQATLRKQIESGEKENQQVNVDISEVAQVQDLSQVEQRELQAKHEALLNQGDQQQADEIAQKIREDEVKAKEAEQKLNALFDRQDEITAEAQQREQEIVTLDDEINFSSQQLDVLEQQMTEEQADVSIKITGTLYPMTTITTAHTSVRTKQAMKALLIRERAKRTPTGDEVWKIVTESLK